MHLVLGRSRMRAGQSNGNGLKKQCGELQFAGNPSGAWVTSSDTIGADSRVPSIPIREGRRQTEQAAPWSTPIPCFRSPYDTTHIPFWFQPVAAVNEARLRQRKPYHGRPEEVGGRMADCGQDSSHLHGFSSGIPQTQDAASMANPEVQKCR